MNPSSNSRMRLYFSLLIVLMVLSITKLSLVNCRVLLPRPIKIEKLVTTTHELVQEKLKFSTTSVAIEKTNSKVDYKRRRVLIENQYHTMGSGPSRRGSGH
ncbi:hypothetical protein Lalb_Chr16g0388901 [Lupinus albus]|uniref:Uncharacterized protein n=1 Tax=Lupinus albus TaxID=3870 RepID=A0A6A4NVJ4_LUPAL|nr:hypothetical protein Lalb_Chr16g0388901 [Lupinus albus]